MQRALLVALLRLESSFPAGNGHGMTGELSRSNELAGAETLKFGYKGRVFLSAIPPPVRVLYVRENSRSHSRVVDHQTRN